MSVAEAAECESARFSGTVMFQRLISRQQGHQRARQNFSTLVPDGSGKVSPSKKGGGKRFKASPEKSSSLRSSYNLNKMVSKQVNRP